ncbi:putative F-box/kelch-repeat protein At1g61540 isoform X2 [Rhododendron vialii]|uniref:putative F-box/kelch-repeat protein At1g61540 isoform X2 n=1 Tax=Rhododendron vialii TaxID=182163 RepID=UPI0026603D85|nr:putative F-box/kelch-repeat protein At1g61540 isoform X2 [Rhododendron vialii]
MQMNAADGGDWKEGLVVSGKRSKSDGKEGLVGFGKRCRSSRSSYDLQEELDKCPCLFGYPSSDGPVLYCFNLDEKSQSKRNFCRRCCADIFGEDKAAEDKPPELVGMRLLTSPPSNKSGLTPDCSMTVAVGGSVVYALGGSSEDSEKEGRWLYSNKVFYFDTNHPRKGWIQGPDMLNKRHGGKAVDVEGKIYVFGGVDYKNKDKKKARHPWAEFLDPKKNEWEPIPPPPKRFGMHKSDLCITPVLYGGGPRDGKKILLGCCSYIYHVNARCWEEFRPKRSLNFSSNLTAVGNFLYWTFRGIFYTFDMKTEKFDWGTIEGYPMTKYQADLLLPEPALLHLGGSHFCFLTLKDLPGDPIKVRCSKFRVSHQGGFKASIVCRETFIIPHPLTVYSSCAFVIVELR